MAETTPLVQELESKLDETLPTVDSLLSEIQLDIKGPITAILERHLKDMGPLAMEMAKVAQANDLALQQAIELLKDVYGDEEIDTTTMNGIRDYFKEQGIEAPR